MRPKIKMQLGSPRSTETQASVSEPVDIQHKKSPGQLVNMTLVEEWFGMEAHGSIDTDPPSPRCQVRPSGSTHPAVNVAHACPPNSSLAATKQACSSGDAISAARQAASKSDSIEHDKNWESFWQVVSLFERTARIKAADLLTALGKDRGCTARSKDGAPPSAVLRALAEAKAQGLNITELADGVVERRFMSKIVESSSQTYASHLKMIAWASELFGACPLGCTVEHIRRVAAVCTCASTQRGWLSAWAMAHQVAAVPWQGDSDVILRGIRLGTSKCRIPRFPRNRVDGRMVLRLLKRAVSEGKMWWSVILVLTYSFLLRMPSELFSQYDRSKLEQRGGRFTYSPIRRKQRLDWCAATAFCTCGTSEPMCLCVWLPVLDELEAQKSARLGGYSPSSWTAELRQLLAKEGIANPEQWFGHDVRRGAAADVFAASGVDAMLARGGWRSIGGARPYVSGDEVVAGQLAQNLMDDSAPEN